MQIQKLESVGCGIDIDSGFVYPLNVGGDADQDAGVHINDLDPCWWEPISPTDRQHLLDVAERISYREKMKEWGEEA